MKYMGELWVLLEFAPEASKKLFHANVGVGSWFSHLIQASMGFTIEGRVIWVEIEGITFKTWLGNSFKRIASKWVELMHIDDQEDNCFHSKRLCINTKVEKNIFESFKIIFRGKEGDLQVEDTGICGGESDVEEVPETLFEERLQNNNNPEEVSTGQKENHSEDPFNIYALLKNKNDIAERDNNSEHSLKYPPGYTPNDGTEAHCKNVEDSKKESGEISQGCYEEEVNNVFKDNCSNKGSKEDVAESVCSGHFKKSVTPREFSGVTRHKMENMELFSVKTCWGNFAFDYVHSDSVGEVVIMGDINEVRYKSERFDSLFNVQAITLERYLSDHRPILLRETHFDYGPTPF
ncbi:hypothetical protein Tco_0303324 [Tanacetum coccineum]